MKKESKKKWKKPELIVLVRGESSEAVLTSCKAGPGTDGPGHDYEPCKSAPLLGCRICSQYSTT